METLFIDDQINFKQVFTDEQGESIQATGRAFLRADEDQDYEWTDVVIEFYDEEKQKFKCIYNEDIEKYIPRIFLCFDVEDPRKFALRVSCAFQKRLHADSLIRQKFYISAMPAEHLSELSIDSRENLDHLVKIKRLENSETTALMIEVCQEYAHIMNGIIFDKYLKD